MTLYVHLTEHGVEPTKVMKTEDGEVVMSWWDHPANFEFTAEIDTTDGQPLHHPRGSVTLGGQYTYMAPAGDPAGTQVSSRGWISPDYIYPGTYTFKVGPNGHRHACFRMPEGGWVARFAHRVTEMEPSVIPTRTGAEFAGVTKRIFIVLDGSILYKTVTINTGEYFEVRKDRTVSLSGFDAVVTEVLY